MARSKINAAFLAAGTFLVLCLAASCLPRQSAPADPSAVLENPAYLQSVDDTSGVLRSPPGNLKVDWRRRIYGYSVVPGGAYTPAELRQAMERDPRVARHYRDVELARVRAERLSDTKLYYASYCMDGQIYWTNKQIPVRKGEPVLTDGSQMIRARCGNKLSDWPQTPLAPRFKEPHEKEFEFAEIIPLEELLTGHRGSFVMPPFWLPILFVPPSHHHRVKPADVVPEPSSWLLLGSGLALMGAGWALRRGFRGL